MSTHNLIINRIVVPATKTALFAAWSAGASVGIFDPKDNLWTIGLVSCVRMESGYSMGKPEHFLVTLCLPSGECEELYVRTQS